MLKRKFFLIFALVLFLISSFGTCKRTTPFEPTPQFVTVEGIYERVYEITYAWDNSLPTIGISPTEIGGWTTKATEVVKDDKFKFECKGLLKPNYPNGKPYELMVGHNKVWTKERTTVAQNVYLNGKLLKAISQVGEHEIAKFRVDSNDRIYDAFD